MDDPIESIGKAIEANNGQCAVIDDALTKSMDMALRYRGGKYGVQVVSVFGQSRLTAMYGVNVVTVDISVDGIEALIEEILTVWDMAD